MSNIRDNRRLVEIAPVGKIRMKRRSRKRPQRGLILLKSTTGSHRQDRLEWMKLRWEIQWQLRNTCPLV